MRTFLSRFIATLRAKVRFLCRFTARLLRGAARVACVIRSLRVFAGSMRLLRRVFARARFLSRLTAARSRAAPVLRALRARVVSTRLLRGVLARATGLDRARGADAMARLGEGAAEKLRDVLFGAGRAATWPLPFADTACAAGAALPFALVADLSFGAPHAVSARARLPMHVKNTIRFMIFPLFCLC